MESASVEKGGKGFAHEPTRNGSTAEGELEEVFGYKSELKRNRSLFTLLFQSLAIAVCPPALMIADHVLTVIVCVH